MISVILAAGMGTRLTPYTDTRPKCLIDVGGRTLLDRSLDSLRAAGVERTIVVTGYRHEQIKQALDARADRSSLVTVHNPSYETTGSMYSLALVQPLVDDDFLLLESDLLYEPRCITALQDTVHPDVLLLSDPLGNGDDVGVRVNPKGELVDLGKHITAFGSDVPRCLVGVSRISRSFLARLVQFAEQTPGAMQSHYEEGIHDAGKALNHPIHTVHIPDLSWTEIDTADDLERARTMRR